MPDLNLNIHTLGSKEAIKSVKDINSVIKDMSKLAKNSAFGDMNAKQVGKADKLLKQFNTTQMQTIKLAKEYGAQVNVLNKALQQTEAIYGKSKQGREQLKSLTSMRDEARLNARRLQGSVNRGRGIAGEIAESRGSSNPSEGPGLFGGVAKGAGLGVLSMGAIGFVIGKAIMAGVQQSNKNLASITQIAGSSRGGTSGLLNEIATSFGPGSITAEAASMGFGSKQKLLEEMQSQQNTGLTADHRSIIDALAMSRIGVSTDQSHALMAMQSAGMPAVATDPTKNGGKTASSFVNFKRIMAEAVTVGMTGVKSGDFIDSVNRMADVTLKTAGSVDVGRIADTMAAAARLNRSSLQGEQGAANMATLQTSLLNPGGGIAGKMLSLQAGGFGTSTWDVLKAQRNLEGGLTQQSVGTVFGALRGKGEAGYAALREITHGGISANVAKDMLDASFNSHPEIKGSKSYHLEDLMGNSPAVKAIIGKLPAQQMQILTEFQKKIAEAGPVAEADVFKQALMDTIMDPIVSIANATQKMAFGWGFAETPTEKADTRTHRMVSLTDAGSASPAAAGPTPAGYSVNPGTKWTRQPGTYGAEDKGELAKQ
jgi:hypothetical protein